MDDILASIRRILNEEDAPAVASAEPAAAVAEAEVLELDHSMMVPDVEGPVPAAPSQAAVIAQEMRTEPIVVASAPAIPQAVPMRPQPGVGPLVAPEAAAAAAVSVGALMRTLANERATATHRGGPTIEDLVRDEIRPLLKEWLDLHLAPMVERLVRAEIERVVSRMT